MASYNRPGGNVTGVVFFNAVLAAKRLELLRQLVPGATTIAMLVEPKHCEYRGRADETPQATAAVDREATTSFFMSGTERDIETAFATLVERRVGALLVGSGGFLNSNRERLVALAARHAIPAIYGTA